MSDIFQLQLSNNKLYPYKLIKSPRAKYIRIKISTHGEISVVLPKGVASKFAHEFVRKKISWISKTIKNSSDTYQISFPDTLDFKLLNEKWHIDYIESSIVNGVQLKEVSDDRIEVIGESKNWDATKDLLNQWCKKKAKDTFKRMIESLAEEHGFHFKKLTIRSQKTRWGSCSASKNISLNSKLLLMPASVVEYVIIHELCHTIEMNHSKDFWKLVEECDDNFKNNREKLKHIGKTIVI